MRKLKIRIPVPRPGRFHSTKKGAKGYDRKKVKQYALKQID